MRDIQTQTESHNIDAATQPGPQANTEAKRSARTTKGKPTYATTPMPAGATAKRPADTKSEIVLKKLRAAKGVSIDQLIQATGWQAHSIRGFLSGTVKKKLGLVVTSEAGKDGVRRYRIGEAPNAG